MQAFKNNLTSEEFWLRLVFMLLHLVLLEVAASVLVLLIVVQFLYRLFNESSHIAILKFSNSLGRFIHHSYRFLSYQTQSKPFPFNDWPEAEGMPHKEDHSQAPNE
ncbi:DUF4389 domain-containing protein [Oceanospirillaceae bacterium]|jgi:hypothetical protein|uniref:DUF4389 domain-containing protein n=1 Tax=Candidatus Njordibacter sp. Uisw_002 TaxID=3230971 RepID=UPI00236D93C2|nr:DUF4389 domain-containing protein [Oceanospirillaceae bacterium]MDC1509295.1 DUF4389 domain-containing protein [Oceanospirillaceae bacterium]|tara:strand:+ start:3332 stop:3649 length:318 start_codon:yes stop_codon:yes gene_type:complete